MNHTDELAKRIMAAAKFMAWGTIIYFGVAFVLAGLYWDELMGIRDTIHLALTGRTP